MTIAEALHRAATTFIENSIPSPALEAECLLRDVLGVDRARLFSRLQEEMAPAQAAGFRERVDLRLRRQPTAYILRQREFFGIDFYVDDRVLIPRPETELLVEKAIDIVRHRPPCGESGCTIADVGTGSGAIAVALALSLPHIEVYATDVSAAALEVAAINCRHHVEDRVHLLHGDLLGPLPRAVDIIVANLPYILDSDMQSLDPEVRLEPQVALCGGPDGLDLVRRLLTDAPAKLLPGGWLLLEVGLGQAPAVMEEAKRCMPGSRVSVAKDLGGIDRAVAVHLSA